VCLRNQLRIPEFATDTNSLKGEASSTLDGFMGTVGYRSSSDNSILFSIVKNNFKSSSFF
jgi:hypothetical protein